MTTSNPGQALIAGGGIAGMAAAAALARLGWQVQVYERAESFGEVGAGLQMSPNAARVLRWLGVLDAAERTGSRPERAELRDGVTGEQIYRADLGDTAERRWGAPYLHLHRADLHHVLADAAIANSAELRTGSPVKLYAHRPEGVRVTLENGTHLTGDLVIGADGIRSAMRTALNGPEAPDFTGHVAWRGTIPADKLPEGLIDRAATVWAGAGHHVVIYPLRGGSLINFVAVEEGADWTEEGWTAPGDADVLRAMFAGWHPTVTQVLAAAEAPFRWGLFSRPEQVRWADRNVALIGDAAHPMLPYMAQGAAMALEDVAVLVRCLTSYRDIAEALLEYEKERWHRVTRVQAQSRANGRLFHKTSRMGQLAARLPIKLATGIAPGFAAGRLDWLYGYDALDGTG